MELTIATSIAVAMAVAVVGPDSPRPRRTNFLNALSRRGVLAYARPRIPDFLRLQTTSSPGRKGSRTSRNGPRCSMGWLIPILGETLWHWSSRGPRRGWMMKQ